MKILHTSDWHIGKRLLGYERLTEQADVLDEIALISNQENVELVLIAGDIFDHYTPSADAETLFYEKIKLIAGEHRSVLLISGNHDDGVRLSSIAPFCETQGVYIVGNTRQLKGIFDENRKTHPVKFGKGYIIFQNEKGEQVFISTLPYPNEARFKEEKLDLPYAQRIKNWIDEGHKHNTENLPSIFMSHIFVAGGEISSSEREIDLGGAKAVPIDVLPTCDYIALGHLHKKQRMGKNHCYYSGSPLQYSFDETADKSVKVFDLTKNGVENLKDVPLTKGKKLIRLQAETVAEGEALLKLYPENLVELKLFLSAPITSSDTIRLTSNPNLISLQPQVLQDETLQFESRKGLSGEALFDAYYKANYDTEPSADLKALFLQILSSLDAGND